MKNFFVVLAATIVVGFFLGMSVLNITSHDSLSQIPNNTSDETYLKSSLQDQKVGVVWLNPIKYVIRGSIGSGVSAKTVALLLLLTVVTAFIAGVRHIVGVQSFGLFLPSALSVVFIVIGPFFGIGLFVLIMVIASLVRFSLRKLKVRLQYLPRMAFILWAVVVAVLIILFLAPIFGGIDFGSVSVLPLFILILLAEDFIRVQLGKSVKTAINLTTETLILAFVSYLILSFIPLQRFALLNPEILLIAVALFDFLLGKYVGLRFLEYYRFRKLIRS